MTKNTTAQELKNCRCSIYTAVTAEITDADGEMIDIEEISTGCTATTRNEFAQGHDAKLKSFLIKAGVAGYEVARVEGGLRVSNDAASMAREYGFAHMVVDGIAKGIAKKLAAADRAERMHEAKAAKQAPKAAPAPVVEELTEVEEAPEAQVEAIPAGPVKAKVGRWTYEGVIVDDRFHYTSKLGQAKSTDAFTLIIK